MGIPSALASLVEGFGEDVVAYNPSRNALQVRGCKGYIIMNIPLSNAQTAALDSRGVNGSAAQGTADLLGVVRSIGGDAETAPRH